MHNFKCIILNAHLINVLSDLHGHLKNTNNTAKESTASFLGSKFPKI